MTNIVYANSWVDENNRAYANVQFKEPININTSEDANVFFVKIIPGLSYVKDYENYYVKYSEITFTSDMKNAIVPLKYFSELVEINALYLNESGSTTSTNVLLLNFYEILTSEPEFSAKGEPESLLVHNSISKNAVLWLSGYSYEEGFESTYRCSYLYDTGELDEVEKPILEEFAIGQGTISPRNWSSYENRDGHKCIIKPIILLKIIEAQDVYFYVEIQGQVSFFKIYFNGEFFETDNRGLPSKFL